MRTKGDPHLEGPESPRQLRPEVGVALREVNGYGLPAEYELEKEPAEWDFYDIAVLSFFWANHPYQNLCYG